MMAMSRPSPRASQDNNDTLNMQRNRPSTDYRMLTAPSVDPSATLPIRDLPRCLSNLGTVSPEPGGYRSLVARRRTAGLIERQSLYMVSPLQHTLLTGEVQF